MGHLKASRFGAKTAAKRLVGRVFSRRIERSWAFSAEEFWRYQRNECFNTYRVAVGSTPYYAEHKSLYPPLERLADVDAVFGALPILTKQDLRTHGESFWSRSAFPRVVNTTSGTSGTPLRLAAAPLELAFGQAVYDHWLRRTTGHVRPRILYVTGFVTPTDPDDLIWRDCVTGAAYLSIYSLQRSSSDTISRLIEEFRPDCIAGYASAVNELATLLRARRERVASTAVVTSEVLQPQWRENITQHLCHRVIDFYGSQEASHAVGECAAGARHINPLVGMIELLDDRGIPVPAGEVGRVVVTGFIRRAMPLIRYDIGDMAESTGFVTGCSCGLQWPTIGNVFGRSEDLVLTPDGRRIGYLCFHATKDLAGIVEAQLIQSGLLSFTMRIVPQNAGLDREYVEQHVANQIIARLGYTPAVDFEYLERIPRGPNEKFKSVVVAIGQHSA